MRDPIVEEIRRVREEHAARFNFDLEAIVADLMRSEADRDWPRASFSPRRIEEPMAQAEPQPTTAVARE